MPLLADYAITPDVFDVTSYSNASECEARLETVRGAMVDDGLVRDLRGGEWSALFKPEARAWHPRGLELVKKLAAQGRLVRCSPALSDPPANDSSWCAEALASHNTRPLSGGVIVTELVKREHAGEPLVARIDRLSGAPWWTARSPSVRLTRTVADYRKHLDLMLRYSNLLVFIDPHLDPEKLGYRDFGALLSLVGGRTPAPKIEIHRVCYEGSGRWRKFPMRENREYFRRRFRNGLGEVLSTAGLSAEVFIWDDFHDRYLISNLVGISLPNGFDTTTAPGSITRWIRLGRNDRDDIRREFNVASRRHELLSHFKVPDGVRQTRNPLPTSARRGTHLAG